MKTYFLSFDFYNRDINKFWSGIIDMDLNDDDLLDVVKTVIKDNFHEADCLNVTIKITNLNNLEL